MAYQALLFCPEEKTARTVTQVLAELEFSVEPCTEPFAAVKKLMSQHFDAIVVDCDNEQNATLLFKSSRNSTSNQTSLAVAIVEGQAGVAKAFRIGANLVLTKPINVEQSKGTLRVARGLLRKGEPGKAAPAAAPTANAPAPTSATSATPAATLTSTHAKPLATKPMPAARPSLSAATGARPAPVVKPATTSSARPAIPVAAAKTVSPVTAEIAPGVGNRHTVEAEAPIPAPNKAAFSAPTPSTSTLQPSFAGSSGAATAPSPAREPELAASAPAIPKLELKTVEMVKQPELATEVLAPSAELAPPTFTFGGANAAEPSSGSAKKIVLGLVAAIVIAAAGYAGWTYYQGRSSQSVTKITPPITITPKSQPAPRPTAQSATPASSETHSDATALAVGDNHHADTEADDSTAAKSEKPAHPAKTSAKPSAAAVFTETPTADVEIPAPLVVKSGSQPHIKTPAASADAPAPSMIGIAAPASGGALANIVADEPAAKPVLQHMKVSQGVAQGLIIKRVAPEYPRSALTMHVEGAVELAATISKDGDIKDVKVLKGDQQLGRAAVQAVKQWKYKPYLLNSEPVEIQTQITVEFKLPQ